jgi:hypothetical protein
MAKKYHVTTIVPEIAAYNFTAGEVMCNLTKLPLPVRMGESCKLVDVKAVDGGNIGNDLIVFFVENNSGGNLGTLNAPFNISFANLNKNIYLGHRVLDSHTNLVNLDLYESSSLGEPNIVLRAAKEGEGVETGCYFSLISEDGYDSSGLTTNMISLTFTFEV